MKFGYNACYGIKRKREIKHTKIEVRAESELCDMIHTADPRPMILRSGFEKRVADGESCMGGFRFNGGLSNIPNKPAHAGEKSIKSPKQILRVKSTQGDINKNTQKVKVINKSQKKQSR